MDKCPKDFHGHRVIKGWNHETIRKHFSPNAEFWILELEPDDRGKLYARTNNTTTCRFDDWVTDIKRMIEKAPYDWSPKSKVRLLFNSKEGYTYSVPVED